MNSHLIYHRHTEYRFHSNSTKNQNPKKVSFQKTFSSCNHILPNQILFSEKTMNHFHCSNTFVYSSRLPHVGNPFVFE